MAVFTNIATLTKADLLRALQDVEDDARIYVMATNSVVQMALAGATVGTKDIYLGLSNNTTNEVDGIALVADFRPAN